MKVQNATQRHGATSRGQPSALAYKLAPRYQWPVWIDENEFVVRWLFEHAAVRCIDPARIALSGDSARGGIVSGKLSLSLDPNGRDVSPRSPASSKVQSLQGNRVMPPSTTDDWVVLKDLSLFAKHGLFDAEAELGQRFYVDVAVRADLSYAERKDEAEGTVNWADLVDVTTNAFTGRRYKLVEAAAAAIAQAVFDHFNCAERVRVEVRKPSAPIEAIFAYTSIVVERQRDSHGDLGR